MISKELKLKFEKIIEINNVNWNIIEDIVKSDANILRPIKGIAFEEFFKKILLKQDKTIEIIDGKGDSDIDLFVNGFGLQLKTIDKGSTKQNEFIGVALHKTHGKEKRPHNLYSKNNKTFDFLVVLHPVSGIIIVPYDEIPEHKKWKDYLNDPAKFPWDTKWLNRWDLIGLKNLQGKTIDDRTHKEVSEIPFLSSITFLEDYEIIEMLCKPEYFRAAVMGLKGNIKEFWFINYLKECGVEVELPKGAYPKYDILIKNKKNLYKRVQIKGTSKNMCDIENKKIGVEIMGTHGQFPKRGYKKDMFDYVAIIISNKQLPSNYLKNGELGFIMIPVDDLPLHYKIGKGKEFNNMEWNKAEFKDIIYPNIKLSFEKNDNGIIFKPAINSYKKVKGYDTIPLNSSFRKNNTYFLNKLPKEFNS